MAKNNNNLSLEQRLWNAADQLRANSGLKAAQYSQPVLGLIFLRFADFKFSLVDKNLKEEKTKQTGAKIGRDREYGPSYYQAKGVMYIPPEARYKHLLNLPEGENIGKAINEAMKGVEEHNPDLKGILPKSYTRIDDDLLIGLLKNFSEIPMDVEGDMFGKIYEYFLGKFAMAEGQKGGEFFTPRSIVKLIVEIIEPFKGRIFDPACGSGGMFVQSAQFINEHKKNGNGASNLMAIYGQEKTLETAQLCKLNIAVHGLSGEIKQANTMYEDLHKSVGKFDFVMANPPFNVKGVDREKIKGDPRYPFGIPSNNNANYLWIQIFASSLNKNGKAGFVMSNQAGDARGTELEIRKKMIEKDMVDTLIAVASNMFYTVTLPVTLWFLDKNKLDKKKSDILFIDARNIYRQINRKLREFTPEQIEFISGIARLYRGEKVDYVKYLKDQNKLVNKLEPIEKEDKEQIEFRKKNNPELEKEWKKYFVNGYRDVAGLCKNVSIKEVEKQKWSLNPGLYVGVKKRKENNNDFKQSVIQLRDEFKQLTDNAHNIEKKINDNSKIFV